MIKKFLFLALCLTILGLWAQEPQAQSQFSAAPVVVELYTSQSCSSCPPADKFFSELAQRPNIIAVGCHVTYWDHLNWKDTLSQEFCTSRQKRYSQTMQSNRVYTPQMVINGQIHFVGSKKRSVNSFIKKAAKKKDVHLISIQPSAQGKFTVYLPDTKRGDYWLWAIGYKKAHTESLHAGENRGRSIEYINTAITLESLGSWAGESSMRMLSKPNNPEVDGLAIIAQRTTHGPIEAAGMIEF